jgi:hypothetical protein
MWMMLLAGLVVVSPALIVVLWYIDRPEWFLPALVSLVINSLPFIGAIFLLRAQNRKGERMDAH